MTMYVLSDIYFWRQKVRTVSKWNASTCTKAQLTQVALLRGPTAPKKKCLKWPSKQAIGQVQVVLYQTANCTSKQSVSHKCIMGRDKKPQMVASAAPSAEYKFSVDVGDGQTNR